MLIVYERFQPKYHLKKKRKKFSFRACIQRQGLISEIKYTLNENCKHFYRLEDTYPRFASREKKKEKNHMLTTYKCRNRWYFLSSLLKSLAKLRIRGAPRTYAQD